MGYCRWNRASTRSGRAIVHLGGLPHTLASRATIAIVPALRNEILSLVINAKLLSPSNTCTCSCGTRTSNHGLTATSPSRDGLPHPWEGPDDHQRTGGERYS